MHWAVGLQGLLFCSIRLGAYKIRGPAPKKAASIQQSLNGFRVWGHRGPDSRDKEWL